MVASDSALAAGFGDCQFSFSVPNVANASFYNVAIDGQQSQQYSESDRASNGWTIDQALRVRVGSSIVG